MCCAGGSAFEGLASAFEAARHGAVDDLVTDLHPDTADDRGVDVDVQEHRAPVQPTERAFEACPLGVD